MSLGHIPHTRLCPAVGPGFCDVPAVERNGAARRRQKADDRFHKGALPHAVSADNGDDLPLLHMHADAFQDHHLFIAGHHILDL
ncbi:hypothetical protein SDC9_206402 [bioreactor metagenome]|uniref:Uncharacterized protein n=1 Tax=bioreactor metagenome TaxID=1076179 RepID=A0A645J4Y5_9ZZZZ